MMALQADEIQEQINNLFIQQFKHYTGGSPGLSVPHIPRVPLKYFENRTIILGQETNTWYRNGEEDGLKSIFLKNLDNVSETCLTKRYDDFINEYAKNYRGKFWAFNKLLYKEKIITGELVSEENNLSHCWLNLFTIEACKDKKDGSGRPTKNGVLAQKILQLQEDLIFKVLEVLKPKLIISLTGHSLDNVLINNALCTKELEIKPIDKLEILTKEMLAEIIIKDVNSPLFGTKIIRCYHPTYFMARFNAHKATRDKILSRVISSSNSRYYTDIVLQNLKEYKAQFNALN